MKISLTQTLTQKQAQVSGTTVIVLLVAISAFLGNLYGTPTSTTFAIAFSVAVVFSDAFGAAFSGIVTV